MSQLLSIRSTPHAGQLRYHDFTKLRELHLERLRRQQSVGLLSSTTTTNRFFWSSGGGSAGSGGGMSLTSNNPFQTAMRDFQLKRLERDANANMQDPIAQYNFLSELALAYPNAVIERMRHPAFKNAAMSVETVTLYLQLLQQTNNLSLLDVDDLLTRLKQTDPMTATHLQSEWQERVVHNTERKFSKQEQAQQLYQIMTTAVVPGGIAAGVVAGGSSMGARGGAGMMMGMGGIGGVLSGGGGTNPKNPLHVQVVTPMGSARGAVIGFISRAALLLVAFSAIGALMDERGLGRGMPGVGGSSKHVQEADDGKTGSGQRKVKFADVKGVTEAKAELEEIVMYLKDPSRFTRLGGKLPRGLLLTGPPGTGKTLLAKAIAGEADVPFFYSSGSQFEEVYVGLGAKRIRELFEAAKKKAPAIIFIDEIDAVGGTRRLKDQSALKMTLNELLVQLDGFDENNGIIVIGATNFMESLDSALLRPGRFDKHVTVPLPDVGGRKEILEMYAQKTKLAPDADLNVLARGTTGMSGADLYNLINQAALKASIDGLNAIDMKTLEYAKDKILMGAERKTAVITKETARCTAYHEAGHAVVAVLTEGAMPIHKATIMPRGGALGMVTMLPEGDQSSQSLKEMTAFMDIAMGGRVAEELIFGRENVTSGAMSDIQNATRVARNMVTKYGFSDEVGIVFHGGTTGEESASAETRALIDMEVKKLSEAAYKRAKDLLIKYHKEHKLLAETLLEYETLTGDEVRDLVKKRIKPKRPVINKNQGARGDASVLETKKTKSASASDSKKRKGLLARMGVVSDESSTDDSSSSSSRSQ